MNYLQNLETELQTRLEQGSALELEEWEGWSANLIAYVKKAVLESFKNGREAAKNRGKGRTNQPPRNLPTSFNKPKE